MIWTIPNILTMARIVAAPFVALVFVLFDRPMADWLAAALFAGAAVTDFFDGWLARKLGQTSEIGKMLDPIADKLIVSTGFLALVLGFGQGTPGAWPLAGAGESNLYLALLVVPAVVIILRETLISGLREYLGDVKLPVTRLAKYKTTLQMFAMGALLLAGGLQVQVHAPSVDAAFASVEEIIGGMDQRAYADYVTYLGLALLWVAAVLTLVTGWDYLTKGMAHLREREAKEIF